MTHVLRLLLVMAFANGAVADPRLKVESPPDPKAVAAAKQIVDDAIVAKGGRKRLAAIKSFKMAATGTTQIAGQPMDVELERVFVLPDKMRVDADLGKRVKVAVAVDGKQGWQLLDDRSGKPQITDISASDLTSIEFERWRDPELILLKASEPNAKVTTGPDENIDGKPQLVVKLRSPTGIDVTLWVDKRTKLISRLTYTDNGANTRDDYSDYKDIKGLKIAHKRNSDTGSRVTKLDLTSVEIDPKIDPKLFQKPPP